jgi:hypothetical protein
MFCAECGKEVATGVAFCTVCGAPAPLASDEQPTAPTLPVAAQPVVAQPVPPAAPAVVAQPAPQPPRKSRGPVILVVVLVILIIAAATVAAVILAKDDKAGSAATTVPGAATTLTDEGPPTTTAPGGVTELVDLATRASDIQASSVLADQGSTTYEPANLTDGQAGTCWAEGVPGYGVGEYLEFTWANPVSITQVRVVPGYDKTADGWDRWMSNGRVRTFDLVFSDGTTQSFTVTDTKAPQIIDLAAAHTVTWLQFVITGVYEASPGPHKAEDTSMSELHFWGTE